MGLRFRKIVRLAPGVRLNVSKRGLSSLSIGGKGLTYNIGRKGTRATGGLPGTGLSYSEYSTHEKREQQTHIDPETGEITQQTVSRGMPWMAVACIALIVGAVYFLRG